LIITLVALGLKLAFYVLHNEHIFVESYVKLFLPVNQGKTFYYSDTCKKEYYFLDPSPLEMLLVYWRKAYRHCHVMLALILMFAEPCQRENCRYLDVCPFRYGNQSLCVLSVPNVF